MYTLDGRRAYKVLVAVVVSCCWERMGHVCVYLTFAARIYLLCSKGEGRRKELRIISRNRRALNRLSPFTIIHNSCRKKGKLFLWGVNRGNSLDFTLLYIYTLATGIPWSQEPTEGAIGALFQYYNHHYCGAGSSSTAISSFLPLS